MSVALQPNPTLPTLTQPYPHNLPQVSNPILPYHTLTQPSPIHPQCPLLRIEPLSVPTRHSVIQSFVSLSAEGKDVLELNDSQQFKIVTAPATSQPMYLRSLLQVTNYIALIVSLSHRISNTPFLTDTYLPTHSYTPPYTYLPPPPLMVRPYLHLISHPTPPLCYGSSTYLPPLSHLPPPPSLFFFMVHPYRHYEPPPR